MERLFETYLPVAEDHGDTLRRAIEPNIVIRGDAELLLQLFSNMLENAIRHTPSGTVIAIELKAVDALAIASVGDNGPGVSDVEREKVFRRFYRVVSSRSSPGNGLGLALAAAIAALHRTKIELADNHPGLRASLSLAT
jgi:signal transduction histidine kinase